MQFGNERRFPTQQLGAQGVEDQVVVTVPVVPGVQRQQHLVAAPQLAQHRPGSTGVQHRITQWAGELVQDRRSGEERQGDLVQLGPHLGAQVVDDHPLTTGDGDRHWFRIAVTHRSLRVGRSHRETGQLESGRPALGRGDDRVAGVGAQPRAGQHDARLAAIHGELVDTDLQQPAVGAEPRERDGRVGA